MNIEFVETPEERMRICESILNALPDWFGVPESIAEYISDCANLPVLACCADGKPVGFLAVCAHNEFTCEIHVMGVLNGYHRLGIGRALVERAEAFAKARGARLFEVKTLDSSNPDPNYAKTRKFYRSMGFMPLECRKEIWDEINPCLIMVKPI